MRSYAWSLFTGDTYTGTKVPYLLSDIDTTILLNYAYELMRNPAGLFVDYAEHQADIDDYIESLLTSLMVDRPMYFIGQIVESASTTLPAGFLYANGDLVLRATYPQLFEAITTFWNLPEDTDDDWFRLPDYRGMVKIGYSHGGGSYPFASSGGEATHDLTVSEIPPHNHVWLDTGTGASTETLFSNGTGFAGGNGTPSQWKTHNTGGGDPHNNMQPYKAVNVMIYAGQGA